MKQMQISREGMAPFRDRCEISTAEIKFSCSHGRSAMRDDKPSNMWSSKGAPIELEPIKTLWTLTWTEYEAVLLRYCDLGLQWKVMASWVHSVYKSRCPCIPNPLLIPLPASVPSRSATPITLIYRIYSTGKASGTLQRTDTCSAVHIISLLDGDSDGAD
jgi:hypothetical protein